MDEPESTDAAGSSVTGEGGSDGKKLYDNPIFEDDEIKVDLGEPATTDDQPGTDLGPGLNTYESNPPLYADTGEQEDENHIPKLNKYERF